MFKAWLLIILFFVGSLTGFLGWLADFSKYYDYSVHGKTTMASLAMKASAPGESIYVDGETKYKIDLRFKTDVGTERFVSPYFPMHVIKRLQDNGGAEIVYLDDNPYQVIFKGQQLPKGFLSLLLGLVAGVVGVYLIKIRHKLVPYTRYLGSDSSGGAG